MDAYLYYSFHKRTNSTRQPGDGGVRVDCELKENTDILNPTIRIHYIEDVDIYEGSYVYLPIFGRYYFITTWRWMLGVWECDCTVDPLASWKNSIGNLSEYILRSSYENDGTVVDNVYPVTTDVSSSITLLDEFYVRAMTGGFYVIGIIGKESTATQGAITYYQMTADQMARLRAYMLSDTFLTDQGLSQLADFVPADATKVIYNPFQYIVSCMWFPFPASAISSDFKDSVSTIDFGWWNTGTGFSAYRIKANAPIYDTQDDMTIADHPQISRGDYLNHAPYTSRVLRLAPFGEIRLPDQYLDSGDKIRIRLNVDFITGNAVLTVYAMTAENGYKMMMVRESQKIGVDIQLAQVGTDYYGAMSQYVADATGEFMSVASGGISLGESIAANDMGGSARNSFMLGATIAAEEMHYTYSTVGNYLKNSAPQVLTSGHNGSLVDYTQNNYLCTTFYNVVDEDNTQLGRPLCKIRQISAIPGYIVVQTPDVDLNCTLPEKLAIARFMASGFFYE